MNRALVLVVSLLFGCSSQPTKPFIVTGGAPPYEEQVDLLDDPVIAYRMDPTGFPIPEDAVASGPSSFTMPRGYHQAARMQNAKLAELGFVVDTTRPSGWAYELHAKKGDKIFVATIATPRGPTDNSSSTLKVVEKQ